MMQVKLKKTKMIFTQKSRNDGTKYYKNPKIYAAVSR